MKKRLTSSLETISRLIPPGLYSRILPRDVIDFFWHAVSDESMPHVHHLYPVIPKADFEAALLYLKENYTFIGYPQLHSHICHGAQLPPKAVHISFDDGYAECFHVVRPLLLEHGIPCTFFLTTDLIDNATLFYRNKQSLCVERLNDSSVDLRTPIIDELASSYQRPIDSLPEFIAWFKDLRASDESLINEICCTLGVDWQTFLVEKQPYLTSEQIRQMHAEGFTIGAHTRTHRKLVDLPSNEIDTEITESCQIIAEITGQKLVPFSFPHSAWGLDREHLAGIRNRQPQIGLLFDTKGLRRDAPFIHNRVWAERPLTDSPVEGAKQIMVHLRLAYQEAWVDEMMIRGRKLRL